jgi:toxin YoeB
LKVVFAEEAWEDYLGWQAVADKGVGLARVNLLIEEIRRHPFTGTGKPEGLKGDLAGCWSRRINVTDRLVYRVSGTKGKDQKVEIIQCKLHY